MQEAGIVPNDVTLAFWALVLAAIVATGKSLSVIIGKLGDLILARMDFVIERQRHNTAAIEALKSSVDCVSETTVQHMIDYRLVEHGLIEKPTAWEENKDEQPERKGTPVGVHTEDGDAERG